MMPRFRLEFQTKGIKRKKFETMATYSNRTLKASLRLIAGKPKRPAALHLAGVELSPRMKPGTYKAIVTSAEIVWKYNRNNARLFFRVLEGEFAGTNLEGWFPINQVGNEVKPGCRYHRLCQLACGDDEPDNLHPPARFQGQDLSRVGPLPQIRREESPTR